MSTMYFLQKCDHVKSCCEITMSVQVNFWQIVAALLVVIVLEKLIVYLGHYCHFEFLFLDHEGSHCVKEYVVEDADEELR